MLDAFDKMSATEGGSGSVIVVIGEGDLNLSRTVMWYGSNAQQQVVCTYDPYTPPN